MTPVLPSRNKSVGFGKIWSVGPENLGSPGDIQTKEHRDPLSRSRDSTFTFVGISSLFSKPRPLSSPGNLLPILSCQYSESSLNGYYRNALMNTDGPCTEGTYTHWFVLPRDLDPCGKGHGGLKWHKLPACGNAVHS